MAQYGGEQYGRQTDEYGNPIRQTDEYGNPIHRPSGGGTVGEYGTTGQHGTTGAHQTDPYSTTGTTGAYQTDPLSTTGTHGGRGGGHSYGTTDAGVTGAGLHRRSGSSSSSSSEDDGMGGRRKKGIKEKIKEKLPGGGHGGAQTQGGAYGAGAGGGAYGAGAGGGAYGAGAGGVEQPHEKKGMMEKIKEKLPGGGHP